MILSTLFSSFMTKFQVLHNGKKNTGSLLLPSLTDDRFILINYHSYTSSDLKLLETMQTFGENTLANFIFAFVTGIRRRRETTMKEK